MDKNRVASQLLKIARSLTASNESEVMAEFQKEIKSVKGITDIAWGEMDYGSIPVWLTVATAVQPERYTPKGWMVIVDGKEPIIPPNEIVKNVNKALRGSDFSIVRGSVELPKTRVVRNDRQMKMRTLEYKTDEIRLDVGYTGDLYHE